MKPINISGLYKLRYLSNVSSEIMYKSFYLSLHKYQELLEILRKKSHNETNYNCYPLQDLNMVVTGDN